MNTITELDGAKLVRPQQSNLQRKTFCDRPIETLACLWLLCLSHAQPARLHSWLFVLSPFFTHSQAAWQEPAFR